jgi:hypothetical protein
METNGFAWTAFDKLMDTELYTRLRKGILNGKQLLDLTVMLFDERRLHGIESETSGE